MKKTVPVFFACNDNYVPYLDVALVSIKAHASKDVDYVVTILQTEISEEHKKTLTRHDCENFKVSFYDVTKLVEPLKGTLPDVFYYSLAAYYRLFIETAFPEYEKAIYLDCDVILLTDIAKLYDVDVEGYLVGAVYEQNTDRDPKFTNYVTDIIGIPYYTYFNSGVMLMNLKEFRKFGVRDRFLNMLTTYNFDCLAPDQEYINVICSGRVKYLPNGWNKHSFPDPVEGDLNLCHYALAHKPWHYADTINGEYFWQYAKSSAYYEKIRSEFEAFTDEDRARDYQGFLQIVEGIKRMYSSERTFKKLWFDRGMNL